MHDREEEEPVLLQTLKCPISELLQQVNDERIQYKSVEETPRQGEDLENLSSDDDSAVNKTINSVLDVCASQKSLH